MHEMKDNMDRGACRLRNVTDLQGRGQAGGAEPVLVRTLARPVTCA